MAMQNFAFPFFLERLFQFCFYVSNAFLFFVLLFSFDWLNSYAIFTAVLIVEFIFGLLLLLLLCCRHLLSQAFSFCTTLELTVIATTQA